MMILWFKPYCSLIKPFTVYIYSNNYAKHLYIHICFLSKRVCYFASCRIVNELLLNMDLSLGFENRFCEASSRHILHEDWRHLAFSHSSENTTFHAFSPRQKFMAKSRMIETNSRYLSETWQRIASLLLLPHFLLVLVNDIKKTICQHEGYRVNLTTCRKYLGPSQEPPDIRFLQISSDHFRCHSFSI